MDRNQSIQQQFGAAADRYRVSRYHQGAPDLDAMQAAVELRGDEAVLDVGTGTGHTALAFAPRVAEVVGLDLTPAMLEQARGLAAERGIGNVRLTLSVRALLFGLGSILLGKKPLLVSLCGVCDGIVALVEGEQGG